MQQLFSAVSPLAKPKMKRRAKQKILLTVLQLKPCHLVPKKVEVASVDESTLQLVRQAIMTDVWSRLSGTVYKAVHEELLVIGQVMLRGGCITMPESLRKQTILLAHKGHQGMVSTKARLREKVWWPEMDTQVEEAVRASLRACRAKSQTRIC